MNAIKRAELALEGLSVGDSFGQRFFGSPEIVLNKIKQKQEPQEPWLLTDDSVMAISIVDTLRVRQSIDQDFLAQKFAQRYCKDPMRGYGAGAHAILRSIYAGDHWSRVAPAVFNGSGSYGNGAAMRIAPLGAYFANDVERLKKEALLASEITHYHQEGKVGGVAIALAASWAFRHREQKSLHAREMISFVYDSLPDSETKSGVRRACDLSLECKVQTAVTSLGNGSRISAQDTVPFVLWCAARHMDDFEQAMWTTVSGLGDRDTTCAMVGGIVALYVGKNGIPASWIKKRESLKDWVEN